MRALLKSSALYREHVTIWEASVTSLVSMRIGPKGSVVSAHDNLLLKTLEQNNKEDKNGTVL
jgi:predicted dinucleotide-binding enzyme